MFSYFTLSLAIGVTCYAAELWPSYTPDWFGYLSCALPVVPYILDRVVDWFERAARPVAGVCFLNLTFLATAKGIENHSLVIVGFGLSLGVVAAVVVWADAIREGKCCGTSCRAIVFAAFAAITGFMGAMESWSQPWARIAMPLAAAPVCVAFLLNHASIRYWGAGYCLLLSIVTGLETMGDPRWLATSLLSLLGASAFLRGSFQPPTEQDVEPDEEEDEKPDEDE